MSGLRLVCRVYLSREKKRMNAKRLPALIFCCAYGAAAAAAEVELLSRVPYSTGATQPGRSELSAGRVFSADGRYFVFATSSTAVAPALLDQNGGSDVFVADRQTGKKVLVSIAAGSPQVAADGPSEDPRISADGRFVVFSSWATNLVSPPTSGQQVFRHDLQSRTTRLISHRFGQPGQGAGSFNQVGDISADGRYAAFFSLDDAAQLVPGATERNTFTDFFLWEEATDAFRLISHQAAAPLETSTEGGNYLAVFVGPDGSTAFAGHRQMAFAGPGATFQAMIFEPATGINRLASDAASSPGAGGNSSSYLVCDRSPEGRYLLFSSLATNLVAGQVDTNGVEDLFVFDRNSGTVELVSAKPAAPLAAGNAGSACGRISGDGRWVYFPSQAGDLVAGAIHGAGWDLLRRDRLNGSTALVSRVAGQPSQGAGGVVAEPEDVFAPRPLALSAAGDRLVFASTSFELVNGALLGVGPWSYRWDNPGESVALAVSAPGIPTTASPSQPLAISPDGDATLVATDSPTALTAKPHLAGDATQLVLADGETVARLVTGAAFTGRGTGTVGTAPHDGIGGDRLPGVQIAADGSRAAFATASNEICGGGPHPLCLLDRLTGQLSSINHRFGEKDLPANGPTYPLAFSQDGRYLLVQSRATDLASSDTNGQDDLFVYDSQNGSFQLLDHAAGAPSTTGNNGSRNFREGHAGMMTADGRFVVFDSRSSDLVAGATFPNIFSVNVYLADRQAGTTTLLSHSAGQPLRGGNDRSVNPRISADGQYVAFLSDAGDLVPGMIDGQGSGWADLFLRDLTTGTTTLVSRWHDNQLVSTGCDNRFFMSADGRYLVHGSRYMLMPGGQDPGGIGSVFRFDRTSGFHTLVSHQAGDPATAANSLCQPEAMSQNGRFVLLSCAATDLVPGVSGPQLYLWDGDGGEIRLVTHRQGAPRKGISYEADRPARMAPDGSRVYYTSKDPGVIPGLADAPDSLDVFSWERSSGKVELLTRRAGQSNEAAGADCIFDFGFAPPAGDGALMPFYCAGAGIDLYDNNLEKDLYLAIHSAPLFADGFESGGVAAWSAASP
jgi:Tol biopolymer transport system component